MPRWDTKYLTAMAAQGIGLLGRSPEFKMMLGEMEVASTMHGGFRDAIKWVQPETMQMLYDYLLDAMTTLPPGQKAVRHSLNNFTRSSAQQQGGQPPDSTAARSDK